MASKTKTKIGIIGAGAWGTALSNILAKNQNVILWAKEKNVCDNINKNHENKRFLPKIKLSKKINCTTEINDISDCDILFLVIPVLTYQEQLDGDFKRESIIITVTLTIILS